MKKRLILFLISFSLLAGLIYFSGPFKIWNTLLDANLAFIGLGMVFWFFGSLVRGFRWKYLLKNIGIKIPVTKAVKLYIIGLFLSNLSPAKTGDPIRCVLLKKTEGKSFSQSVSSIFIERILDIITLIVISLIGIFILSFSLKISINYIYAAIGIYISIIMVGVYIVMSKERTEKITGKLVSIFSFIDKVKELEEKVEDFSEKVSISFRKYRNKKVFLVGFCLSVLAWLLNAMISFLAFRALGINVPYVIVLSLMGIGILISFLTLLPGSLGSGEVISVILYTSLISISASTVTASRILGRVMNFWMYAIVGAILLSLLGKNLRKIT